MCSLAFPGDARSVECRPAAMQPKVIVNVDSRRMDLYGLAVSTGPTRQ